MFTFVEFEHCRDNQEEGRYAREAMRGNLEKLLSGMRQRTKRCYEDFSSPELRCPQRQSRRHRSTDELRNDRTESNIGNMRCPFQHYSNNTYRPARRT